ncbi:hypothetical protein Q3G72_011245 [Acer saccharum]|nr:hypothetical protein Q3G72_003237 [Acer saccharum]KAK1591657.1 hypothetical protein Q3G72_011245 [Acer saccharum]
MLSLTTWDGAFPHDRMATFFVLSTQEHSAGNLRSRIFQYQIGSSRRSRASDAATFFVGGARGARFLFFPFDVAFEACSGIAGVIDHGRRKALACLSSSAPVAQRLVTGSGFLIDGPGGNPAVASKEDFSSQSRV